jgi:hypothetical protein
LTAFDLLARGFIQIRSKLRKGSQLTILRQIETHTAT